ncbi:MAG: serine/threonine-protein phosphatase [Gammaproteobacteria bacterium]|nr:serine/threonine-protein phosphatase [Gammaproteobacteria bacterium]
MDIAELQQAFVYLGDKNPQTGLYDTPGGHIAAYSARSPDKDTDNEDSAVAIVCGEDTTVLAVADGAGGLPAARRASNIAINALKSSLKEAANHHQLLRTGIINGFERANHQVLELGAGAATTLAVVGIEGNTARAFHVGDSMAFVVGQRGKVKLQTVDHSPTGFAVEAGFMNNKEAIHHEERHLVSNLIGTSDMRIEIGSAIELAPHDTLLIASDGLTDNLHLDEIISVIRRGRLNQSVAALADRCSRRMDGARVGEPSKPDDLTFLLFRRYPPKRTRRVKS